MNREFVIANMPDLLNKLHYTEKIPTPFCIIFPYISEFISKMVRITPSRVLIDYLLSIEEIMAILSNHKVYASCHNDLNNENILFDGKKLVLIDFEAAGWEDPYFDLTTIAQQNCFDRLEELKFLGNYLKKEPSILEVSKWYLMKQVSYCFHVIHFFQHAYDAGMMEFNESVPSFKEWYQGKLKGIYSYEKTVDLMRYAMVVLHQSLADMAEGSFNQAKKILS